MEKFGPVEMAEEYAKVQEVGIIDESFVLEQAMNAIGRHDADLAGAEPENQPTNYTTHTSIISCVFRGVGAWAAMSWTRRATDRRYK
jgi:hypothetical protein